MEKSLPSAPNLCSDRRTAAVLLGEEFRRCHIRLLSLPGLTAKQCHQLPYHFSVHYGEGCSIGPLRNTGLVEVPPRRRREEQEQCVRAGTRSLQDTDTHEQARPPRSVRHTQHGPSSLSSLSLTFTTQLTGWPAVHPGQTDAENL